MDVNEDDFEEKIINASKKKPILVDFWAEWCMPCRILGPVLEKLAEEYKGKFILAKINVDKNKKLAVKYNIMGIPNVKLFKDGNIADEFVGVKSEEDIKEWLDEKIK